MAGFFLVGGVEYSVIFPTMYDYVRSEGGEGWLYGLSLSAFSISNIITAPLYGLVFDRTKKTKLIVMFANLFEIGGKFLSAFPPDVRARRYFIGNFMYFAASSKYMILGSRFVVGKLVHGIWNWLQFKGSNSSGMGAGAGATIIGELTRITGNKSRTTVFSLFMGMRQIGLVIGKL